MIGTPTIRKPRLEIFEPYPWQIPVWRDKSPVILLTGSAGGGKSRIAAEKLHGFCLKYPRSTAVALRKTRESMVNSTVLFLEMTVACNQGIRHYPAYKRFNYPNGSILAYGGMRDEKQREQIRSIGQAGGIDIAWMEEATGFVENDFQELVARMRGTAAPWNQIILTTNPSGPNHWINKRLLMGGECPVYLSDASMNPANPESYLKSLGMLVGTLGQRLRDGLWVASEGLVYATFGLGNLLGADWEPEFGDDELPILEVELAYDEGYTEPRAILFIQKTGSEVFIFDEIYVRQVLPEKTVERILERMIIHFGRLEDKDEVTGEINIHLDEKGKEIPAVMPAIAVGDPSAVILRRMLRDANIPTRRPGIKDVKEGISHVRQLIEDGQGYRVVKVHPRCSNLITELTEGYIYAEEGTRSDEERPIDANNHACDALRYYLTARLKRRE